jgi:CBS domain-containing protein
MEEAMPLLKIAHQPPAAVPSTATVLEAVQAMAEEGVGAVAVVDDGVLKGIFTERDVMLRVVLRHRDAGQLRVAEVMTTQVETTHADAASDEVLSFMLEHHIRHLPIVDAGGKVQGMLSIRNLLENMVEDLRNELHSLDQYLLNDGPGG